MTFADLPSHEREAAVADFVDAVMLVVRWVGQHRAYPVTTRTPIAAIRALLRPELPSLDTLATLCGWILFQTSFDLAVRPLTAAERNARAVAQRLSDAIQAARHSEETL